MRQTLRVSLVPDEHGVLYVSVSQNPADILNRRKVRWSEAEDNTNRFKFAGIVLDQDDWPNQKILIDSNRIICDNGGSTEDFEYSIFVIHKGELYSTPDTDAGYVGGKPVIRND